MSEPARQHPLHETGGRPTPAPLRDWLVAMKAATGQVHEPEAIAPGPVPVEAALPSQSWEPRIVPADSAPAADPDVAELMAENLMLKAKLRIEDDRHAELQSILAQELRALRAHVDEEMEALNKVRDERDLWMARAEALAQPLFQKR